MSSTLVWTSRRPPRPLKMASHTTSTTMLIHIRYNETRPSSLPSVFDTMGPLLSTTLVCIGYDEFATASLHSTTGLPRPSVFDMMSLGLPHHLNHHTRPYLIRRSSYSLLKPNNSTIFWNLGFGSAFVKTSETLSSVGTYFTTIFLSSTASQIKWYRRSICLV